MAYFLFIDKCNQIFIHLRTYEPAMVSIFLERGAEAARTITFSCSLVKPSLSEIVTGPLKKVSHMNFG